MTLHPFSLLLNVQVMIPAGCLCTPTWSCALVPHWTGGSLQHHGDSSSVGVDWGVLDFKFVNWFLSCWNCSSKSAKGQQVSVYWQYSLDESLFPSGTGWSCGMRSKRVESWVSGMSFVSWLPYVVTMPCVLWHVPKVLSRTFRGNCLQSWDMCVLQWLCRW